jgi:MFS family permease
MIGLLVMGGTRITISLYALSINLSAFQVGSMITMFALMPMFLAVSVGRWLDRVGVALPLLIGALAMCAGTALACWQGHYLRLYPAAALVGSGFMLILIVAQNVVGQAGPPEQRTNRFTTLSLALAAASFGAPVMAGYIIDHLRHQAAFLLFALLALLLLVGTRMRQFRQFHPQAAPASDSQSQTSRGGALALFWHERRLRTVYIINIILASAWDCFMFATPIQGYARGFSAATIGLILGSFSIATFVIRFMMPILTRHFTPWQILGASLLGACVGFLLLPWQHQAGSLMALGFMLGLALGASQPNMLSLLFQAAPEGRVGEVLGIRVTIGNASQVVIPLLFGALSSGLGMTPVFLFASLMLAGGVVLVWQFVSSQTPQY